MIYDPATMVFTRSMPEPTRLPRVDSSNYDAWMNFSRALTSMLRHTGSGTKDGHLRITDDA
eukprot:9511584-Heterocapsa_arctica.AAC.1